MKYALEDPFDLGWRQVARYTYWDLRRWLASHWRMFAAKVDRWLSP
jgi:hypothetical protein